MEEQVRELKQDVKTSFDNEFTTRRSTMSSNEDIIKVEENRPEVIRNINTKIDDCGEYLLSLTIPPLIAAETDLSAVATAVTAAMEVTHHTTSTVHNTAYKSY